MNSKSTSTKSTVKALVIWFVLYGAPLLLAAGTTAWWNAWAYVGENFISIIFINAVVYRKSPDLAHERATASGQSKTWDKILVLFTVALLPLTINILAGLDRRFSWTTSITTPESLFALAALFASSGLIIWSMWVNRFFTSHFHIQTERGHTVISDGPYAIIRHPGYAGMILGSLAVPVLLGSGIGLLVGFVSGGLTILRTGLEDQALQRELPGYLQYTQKVHHRLVPLVW